MTKYKFSAQKCVSSDGLISETESSIMVSQALTIQKIDNEQNENDLRGVDNRRSLLKQML